MEIVFVATFIAIFNNVMLPLFAMKDVRRIQDQLQGTIHEYYSTLKGRMDEPVNEAATTEGETMGDLKRDEIRDSSQCPTHTVQFNAAKYLFVSTQLAIRHPCSPCLDRAIGTRARTIWVRARAAQKPPTASKSL